MARIRRQKRTPHMPSCKSYSLESTGRSRLERVEQGEEVNSNHPGVTPEYPYMCPICYERYKIKREFFIHLETHLSVGRRRRERQSDDPPLDEGPSEPPIQPQPQPQPQPPQPPQPQPQPQHPLSSQPLPEPHLTECVADSWYQPQPQPQQQPQPEPEPEPEPNLEFEPLPQPQPRPHPQGGLTTKMFFFEPRVPPALQDYLDRTNRRRANNRRRTPRVDLTLRLGLKARRGRPRRLLVPLSPIGPIRRFLWFKEYINKLRLAGGNVGAMVGVAGNDVDEIMANSFQTLTDDQLELKVGI